MQHDGPPRLHSRTSHRSSYSQRGQLFTHPTRGGVTADGSRVILDGAFLNSMDVCPMCNAFSVHLIYWKFPFDFVSCAPPWGGKTWASYGCRKMLWANRRDAAALSKEEFHNLIRKHKAADPPLFSVDRHSLEIPRPVSGEALKTSLAMATFSFESPQILGVLQFNLCVNFIHPASPICNLITHRPDIVSNWLSPHAIAVDQTVGRKCWLCLYGTVQENLTL